MMVLLNASANP